MFIDTMPPTLKQLSECMQSFALKMSFYNLFGNARELQLLSLKNTLIYVSDGSTIQLTDSSQSQWVELIASGTLGALTINLPTNTSAIDSQEVLIICNNTITTLALVAPGSSFNVTLSTLAANVAVRFKYSQASNLWYRI